MTTALLNHMQEAGLPCNQEILIDGEIHRYSAKGGRSKDEWYVCYPLPEGQFLCVYGSWRESCEGKHIFKSWSDDTELSYLDDQYEETQRKIQEKLALDAIEGVKTVKSYWESSQPALEHPYLSRKRIKPYGIKVFNDNLLIPVYGTEDQLISLQKISPDGTKRFAYHTNTRFGRYILGEVASARRILVCEGFATGASIHEATGECVAVAFSASNTWKVGHALQEKYPGKSISLCSDLGKAGEESIRKWKEIVNEAVYIPNFRGKGKETDKDYNDMFCHPELGSREVLSQLSPILKTKNLKEMFDEIKPVDWLVENLILRGSINMIYGPGGAGKSSICHSLAFSCSQGLPFWMYHPKKCKVLYVDGELSQMENQSRLGSVIDRWKNIIEEVDETSLVFLTPEMIYSGFEQPIDLYSKEWQKRVDPLIEKSDLIFLDNVSTLTGANADPEYENKAASWINIGDWLRKWKMLGKSFIAVHHSNKNGGFRGTSRVSVDTMTQIRLEPKENSDPLVEIHNKVIFEKRREIPGKWKLPFEVMLRNNQWEIFLS